MLDVTPGNLRREIDSAEKFRDSRIRSLGDLVKAYHGPAYDHSSSCYDSENHAYELTSWMVPQMVFANPRVHCKSRKPGAQQAAAEAIGMALNRWVVDVALRKTLLPIATDTLLSWGVAIVSEEENETLYGVTLPETASKSEAQPMWPVVKRISPHRYGMDPGADSWEEARYEYHRWIRDKNDLLAMAKDDPTWDKEAIEHLAAEDSVEDYARSGRDLPSRGEVQAYEIWVPEVVLDSFPDGQDGEPTAESGYHGTIFTLAVKPSADGVQERFGFIRKPRPFFGPRWGPYVHFGVHTVPDEPYPLGPITATKEQSDELNRIGRGMTQSAERYKRGVLFDAKDAAFAKAWKDAEHDDLIPVPGFDPSRISEIERGGLTEQMMAWRNDRKALLDRVSGFTDMQRGTIQGQGTATEATIADSNADIRAGFVKQQFRDGVEQLLKTAAWYLYHDDQVLFPINPEEAGIYVPGMEIWYQGGDHDPLSGATFDDLEIEIEAYSMERTDEGIRQRKFSEMFSALSSLFPFMAQAPTAPWSELWSLYGDVMNMPEARQLGGQFAQAFAASQGVMAQPSSGSPRLSGDVGAAGVAGGGMMPGPGGTGLPGNASGGIASSGVNL